MFTDATSLDEILILNISVIVSSFLPCNCSQSNSENLNMFHAVTFKSESDEEEKRVRFDKLALNFPHEGAFL